MRCVDRLLLRHRERPGTYVLAMARQALLLLLLLDSELLPFAAGPSVAFLLMHFIAPCARPIMRSEKPRTQRRSSLVFCLIFAGPSFLFLLDVERERDPAALAGARSLIWQELDL